MEGKSLKFCLRAVTDERHDATRIARERARRERRGRCRAQRCRIGHLGKQQWISRRDVGENSEGRHRKQALRGVLRMTVHVFEGVEPSIAGGHQFDDTDRGMSRMASGVVEVAPAQEVSLDLRRQLYDELRWPEARHQIQKALSSDEVDHVLRS